MAHRIAVIASGETERRSLPALCRLLANEEVHLTAVLTPPRQGKLTPKLAFQLAQATAQTTTKIVVLVDTDRNEPSGVVDPFREYFHSHWTDWSRPALVAYARRHLEAWFFADAERLRDYLGSALKLPVGPDEMDNPKLQLTHQLAPRAYTSLVAGEIAAGLDPSIVAAHSPSFTAFLSAMRNGGLAG